jgi:hypothetical protein
VSLLEFAVIYLATDIFGENDAGETSLACPDIP